MRAATSTPDMTDNKVFLLANYFVRAFGDHSNPSGSSIINPYQANPMNAIPLSTFLEAINKQEPLINSLHTRMINQSTMEEGTVDLVSFVVSNELARNRTANLLENGERVQNFLAMQINGNPDDLNLPYLCRKYDYYFARNYSQS
jgi:hypothetical protein